MPESSHCTTTPSSDVYTFDGLLVDTAIRGRRARRTSASDTRPCKSPFAAWLHFEAQHDAIDRRVARFDVVDLNRSPTLGRRLRRAALRLQHAAVRIAEVQREHDGAVHRAVRFSAALRTRS